MCRRRIIPADDIYGSVFHLSLSENLTIFFKQRDGEQHSFLRRYETDGRDDTPMFDIYSSVGYCIVYFCLGFVRTIGWINEMRLHTFFWTDLPSRSPAAKY